MECVQIFRMNKGSGETSYAQNSKLQNKIITLGKPIIKEALIELLRSDKDLGLHSIGIADLGCSSGPNTLFLIMAIMDVILNKLTTSQSPPSSSMEFRVFLVDLFGNDFNTIFTLLPAFNNKLRQDDSYKKLFGGNPNVFVSATPGCFYGRLFPRRSLHFVHSSSSLHWLSRVPPSLMDSTAGVALNKGKVVVSKSSPQCVIDAYAAQFSSDFSKFLKSRAEEVVENGRMVLTFMSRPTLDHKTEESIYHSYQWELLSVAFMSMVSDGLIDEEKVDSFNVPFYSPCKEEVKSEVKKEGSFILDKLEAFEIDWDYVADVGDDDRACGKRLAKTMRAVVESVIEAHFGEEIIMDDLFQRYAELVAKHLLKGKSTYRNVVVSLIRRD